MNKKTPIAALKSPYCESLINFNTTDAGIELRNGDSVWSAVHNTAPTTTDTFLAFVKYGDTKLFYTTQGDSGNNRYFDITTGTASLAHTSATAINGEIYTLYFNKNVYTFGTTTSVGDVYNGSAWGAWGWTFSTIAPIGGCAFKHRAYFVGRGTATYAYGNIDAIAGGTTEIDLGGVILEQSFLSTIAPVTIVTNGSTIQLLAFVFFSGEVLFYAGSYPDSDSWSLIGRGKTGKPLDYNCSIDYQGDALVMTRIGLVSLRDLFLSGGQQASSKTVSEAIDPLWTTLVNYGVNGGSLYYDSAVGRVKFINGAWWSAENQIVIQFPFYDPDGVVSAGNTFFVFDTLRQAWSVHRSGGSGNDRSFVYAIANFRDSLFMNGFKDGAASTYLVILKKEGASDFQDAYDNITKHSYYFESLMAPVPASKTSVMEADQIEPILETDLSAETNYNFVADFGRQTTNDQTAPNTLTTVSKPAANVGIQEATYMQVKMSGTTAASKSVGLKLYSYNVWFDRGAEASR